jgi:hypothetical protein
MAEAMTHPPTRATVRVARVPHNAIRRLAERLPLASALAALAAHLDRLPADIQSVLGDASRHQEPRSRALERYAADLLTAVRAAADLRR